MMWLKLLRIEAGFSQFEISQRAGISQQYYSLIEAGKRETLPPSTAKRIANVLGFMWTRFYDEAKQPQIGEGGEVS